MVALTYAHAYAYAYSASLYACALGVYHVGEIQYRKFQVRWQFKFHACAMVQLSDKPVRTHHRLNKNPNYTCKHANTPLTWNGGLFGSTWPELAHPRVALLRMRNNLNWQRTWNFLYRMIQTRDDTCIIRKFNSNNCFIVCQLQISFLLQVCVQENIT